MTNSRRQLSTALKLGLAVELAAAMQVFVRVPNNPNPLCVDLDRGARERRADAAHKSATLAPRSRFNKGPGTVASHAICDVWEDGGDTAATRAFFGRFSLLMASIARAASAQATRA